MPRRCAQLLGLIAILVPARGHADGWVAVEAPAAAAVSDAQAHVFRAGAMPAVGVYLGRDVWAVGLRGRLGVLRDGPAPTGPGVMDPGVGGLGSVTAALRLGATSGWAELAGGVAVTGSDVAPAFEAGVGWWFATRRFDLGPSLRYMHLVNRDSNASFGSADLVLVGVELRFGKAHPRPLVVQQAALPAPPAPVPQVERDELALIDTAPACVHDPVGCPEVVSPDLPAMVNNRITLGDDVLFDFNRARVKSSGRRIVEAIAAAWRAHADWERITIEGHADLRGSDDWNMELSQLRAERVRAALVKLGFSEDRIDAIGYGRTRPLDLGTTEAAHQRNRRVEFVVDRGGTP